MADYAARATDEAIRSLERRIREVYSEAQKDIEKKTKDFWERHKAKDAIYRQRVKDGKITPEDYQVWLRGQVFQGKQWEAKMEQIEQILADTNRQALNIINGGRIQVFATNSNWQAYQIEKSAGVNFGFGVYDADAVTRLLRDDPDLLPAKKLSVPKDKLWNKGNIVRQITQGIIQGESLDKIAQRLANVTGTNRKAMLTNARTMMTGAQNAGRQESFQRAQKMGIKMKKVWLATLDGHTRTNHRKLDGQAVDVDEPFKIDGYSIMYPGDRHARPEMVYNCRCTMISEIEDYPSQNAQRRDNVTGQPIKDMTYEQWKEAKSDHKSTKGRPTPNNTRTASLDKYEKFKEKYVDKIKKQGEFTLTDEQADELQDKLTRVFNENSYYTNVDSENLDSILKHGFKNQQEILAEGGKVDVNLKIRGASVDQRLYGSDKNISPADRPRFGSLGSSDWDVREKSTYASSYGDVSIRLRKEGLDGMVTWTSDDSFGVYRSKKGIAGMVNKDGVDLSGICLRSTTNPNAEKDMLKRWYDVMSKADDELLHDPDKLEQRVLDSPFSSYIELQFHTKLTVDNIDSVCFRNGISNVSDEVIRTLKENKIPIYVRVPVGEPDKLGRYSKYEIKPWGD